MNRNLGFLQILPALAIAAMLTLATSSVAFAAPEPGHADAAHSDASHGAHDKASVVPTKNQGVASLITALLVFGVVFGILATQVWPKITSGLKDRENKIRQEIEAAESAGRQAQEALQQYQQSLAMARMEAQREIDKARAQAQAIAAELKAKADVELSSMRERAMRDIEAAKRAAIAEVYDQAATRAVDIARGILRREVNPADHARFVEESVSRLETASLN
ncbi:MAG: ATP synthase F0 subunit B [Planctomycetota bacterium]|nr:ATP synthase F0 subunit B [Planctomycetota bacterium]